MKFFSNFLFFHFNKAIIMLLLLLIYNLYLSLNNIFLKINFFAFLQAYIIIKKHIKVNKKRVIRKAMLMSDCNNKYFLKNKTKS